MVTKYGMSDLLGPITYESGSDEVFLGRDFAQTKHYSEKVAAMIDDEVKRIIDDAYTRCESILTENRDLLDITAEYLIAHEVMDADTFEQICRERRAPAEPAPRRESAPEFVEPAEPAPEPEDQNETTEE